MALLAANMPEYAVVFYGAALAGGTITTINPAYTEAEVHHQLVDSGARILVTIAPLVAAPSRPARGLRSPRSTCSAPPEILTGRTGLSRSGR